MHLGVNSMPPQSWELTFVALNTGVNIDTAAQVRERLSSLLVRPGHVILDLRGSALDSTGLGAVLSLQRHLELQGRRLAVVSDDPAFRGLLDRTGVAGSLPVFSDAECAVDYVGRQPASRLAAA